jgi:endonuclease YncB( thermonuclease family)
MYTGPSRAQDHARTITRTPNEAEVNMGLLKLSGTLDVSQFWPTGQSDADTTKVIVTVEGDSFKFSANGTTHFQTTHAFEGARVKGKSGTKTAIGRQGQVTIRLQGIDAPELHYPLPPLGSKAGVLADAREAYRALEKVEYRQYRGETTTAALGRFLHGLGKVACEVTTIVSAPDEVFDTYGRFIGDISVTRDGQRTVLNDWLVENGWAFPTFYKSMTDAEIRHKAALWKTGKQHHKANLWKYYAKTFPTFDPKLVYRRSTVAKPVSVDAAADRGPVLLPKLFRRQAAWWARKKAGILSGTFPAYLRSADLKKDQFHLTDEWLDDHNTARAYGWADVLTGSTFAKEPQEIVFVEDTSTLLDSHGAPVTAW